MRRLFSITISLLLFLPIFAKSVNLDSAIKSAGEIIVSSAKSANLKIISVSDFKADTGKMSLYIL